VDIWQFSKDLQDHYRGNRHERHDASKWQDASYVQVMIFGQFLRQPFPRMAGTRQREFAFVACGSGGGKIANAGETATDLNEPRRPFHQYFRFFHSSNQPRYPKIFSKLGSILISDPIMSRRHSLALSRSRYQLKNLGTAEDVDHRYVKLDASVRTFEDSFA
jgi:hypothetical protein